MHASHLQYFPLAWPFLAILGVILFALFVLLEIGALSFAYMRLGLSARSALILLVASLLGSYVNIPVAQLSGEQAVAAEEVSYFGMVYQVPVLVDWPGTVIAVNVGGAVIPTLLSIYLVFHNRMFISSAIAIAVVAVVVHLLASPVQGFGIAVPVFAPPLVTAAVALLLSRRYAAPLAYVAGSMGTLIGADLTNLDAIGSLGAPVASIGGAGTFDGIFLTGILAVLLASLTLPWTRAPLEQGPAARA
jgi:uncharacterized membrane protein